jgi:hypothetical protein
MWPAGRLGAPNAELARKDSGQGLIPKSGVCEKFSLI